MAHRRNGKTYGNYFCTNIRECCLGDDTGPPKEMPFHTSYAIKVDEGSRVLPVSKSDTIMIRTSTQVKDDAQDDHPGDCDYFDGTKRNQQGTQPVRD